MINKYIEKHIKRQIFLLEKFFKKSDQSHVYTTDLIDTLNISKPTFLKDLTAIQEILGDDFKISFYKQDKQEEIYIENNGICFNEALCRIYRQSDFLNILSFFLTNNTGKTFKEYINEHFYSRAKAYSVKKKVWQYLREINVGQQDVLKKILLITKLETEYGIQCIPSYIRNLYAKEVKKKVDKSFFLTLYEKKKMVVIILLLIQNVGLNMDLNNEKNFFVINMIEIPEKEKKLFLELEVFWKNQNQLKDSIVKFFYKIISTNIYFPSLMNKKQVDSLINQPEIKYLLDLFKEEFGTRILNDIQFLGVVFNCIKFLTLEISEFLLCKEKFDSSQEIYYRVLDLFINWEEHYKEIEFAINTECLNYLVNKIVSILKKEEKLKIYIYSESFLEYIQIFQDLENCLKINAEIVDFWLYNPLQFHLIKGDNRIIITSIEYYKTIFSNEERIHYLRFPMDESEGKNFNSYLLNLIE
ncbi:hypothetical protein [Enterococcus lactis]|uniref:hypothetical protein n=1 Tax=Enterococcus lactis TaxID=357441 RepID=UPI00404298FE